MAHEYETLVRSFSGLGVDEKSVISTLGRWKPEQRQLFRKTSSRFFREEGEHHSFERWDDDHIRQLEIEFSRFKKAVVLRAMHPWERDARWAHHVIFNEHPDTVLVEIACTRSSEELLGVRRAYHALFQRSLEEDVAYHVKESNSRLLVALVSAYRYEGSQVKEGVAKAEAKALGDVIKKKGSVSEGEIVGNHEVIRILATRSKLHVRAVLKHYLEIHGNTIWEDLDGEASLLETVQCLDSPPAYFSKVLDASLTEGVDEHTRDALTRVVVTRADVDMEEIKGEYLKQYGVSLVDKIQNTTYGNYKDFLIALVGGGE